MILIVLNYVLVFFFFFKQKTAYEMRISDWSSDVCSSDLNDAVGAVGRWLLPGVAVPPAQPHVELARGVGRDLREASAHLDVAVRVDGVEHHETHRGVGLQIAELLAPRRMREQQSVARPFEPHRVHLHGAVGADGAQRAVVGLLEQVAQIIRYRNIGHPDNLGPPRRPDRGVDERHATDGTRSDAMARATARPARLAPTVDAEGPYPMKNSRGSSSERESATRNPPCGVRRCRGARC